MSTQVQSVIEDMGLRHVADSRIGGTIVRGVSGGEKRRITIGVQLLRDPGKNRKKVAVRKLTSIFLMGTDLTSSIDIDL